MIPDLSDDLKLTSPKVIEAIIEALAYSDTPPARKINQTRTPAAYFWPEMN